MTSTKILDLPEANRLLLELGLKVGEWNELTDLEDAASHRAFVPSRDATQLYVAANRLLDWIPDAGWVLLQIDNSTAPSEDEASVFEQLMGSVGPNLMERHAFAFRDVAEVKTKLALLINFFLLFEWHVYLAFENGAKSQRLGLLDGVVYFFGRDSEIERADDLVRSIHESPLSFAP